jgi:hypothetical protein
VRERGVGGAYGDKGQGQENHAAERQDPNVVTLINSPTRLLDGTAAEELLAKAMDFLPRNLVSFLDLSQLPQDSLEFVSQPH